jgi:hypothetical protein
LRPVIPHIYGFGKDIYPAAEIERILIKLPDLTRTDTVIFLDEELELLRAEIPGTAIELYYPARTCLHLVRGDAGIFCVAAIKLPTHASHNTRDNIALAKLACWRFFNETNRFDPKDARKFHSRRVALPREQLGAIQSEGFDMDQDFAVLRRGNGEALNFKNFRPTRFVDHNGLHGRYHAFLTKAIPWDRLSQAIPLDSFAPRCRCV